MITVKHSSKVTTLWIIQMRQVFACDYIFNPGLSLFLWVAYMHDEEETDSHWAFLSNVGLHCRLILFSQTGRFTRSKKKQEINKKNVCFQL